MWAYVWHIVNLCACNQNSLTKLSTLGLQSWWSTGCPFCMSRYLFASCSACILKQVQKSACVCFCVHVCACVCRCVCGGKVKQHEGACFLLVWVCIWMRMTLHYLWVPQVIWEQLVVKTRTNILRQNDGCIASNALTRTHVASQLHTHTYI